MNARHWLGHSLTAMTAALAIACSGDAPVDPSRGLAAPAASLETEAPDLTGCEKLSAGEGDTLSFHAYATGVQIYRWNGATWAFVAPEASLYADAGLHGKVGTHYVGPTWESNSGSKVVAAARDRCTPNANAIAWLILDAVSTEGPGIFDGTTVVQRVNTVGGLAPAAPGTVVGQEARVPYTAEYYFYRAN
jgi:hypothetical protein